MNMEEVKLPTNNAGFFMRFFAVFLSSLISICLVSMPAFIFLFTTDIQNTDLTHRFIAFLTYFLALFFLIAVIMTFLNIYLTVKFGGDLGKLLFGLKILDNDTNQYLDWKTALYRWFPGYTFSSVFFGLGYFRIFKNKSNLAWHDELFNTKVVKSSTWLPGIVSILILLGYFVYLTTLFVNFAPEWFQ